MVPRKTPVPLVWGTLTFFDFCPVGGDGHDSLRSNILRSLRHSLSEGGDAVQAVGKIDQDKIAEYIHSHNFKTVVGDVSFGEKGEWSKARIMTVQFQNITGTDVDNFRDGKGETVLWPDQYKNGDPILPYSDIKH